MAEPLKNHFGPDVPSVIGDMLTRVHPRFPKQVFVRDALKGYEALNLLARGKHIAAALRRHLPADYERAVRILVESADPALTPRKPSGMTAFLYLPHVCFVEAFGIDHYDASMQAQYVLTQRFTAEYSIRPFITKYPDKTLALLKRWALDPCRDVRRLVSEGTRPRLPWASRLPQFQRDPRPVLELLELLKDDPELYVRRSVANNLNDIGKDNPALLAETARSWLVDPTPERRWLVEHALRSAIKRADPAALAALGYGGPARVNVGKVVIVPKRAVLGGKVRIDFVVSNATRHEQKALVDLRVHFVKANGKASPKVFKLKTLLLAAGESVKLGKSVSLVEMTTRKHYPGSHRVDVVINGAAQPLGVFELRRARA